MTDFVHFTQSISMLGPQSLSTLSEMWQLVGQGPEFRLPESADPVKMSSLVYALPVPRCCVLLFLYPLTGPDFYSESLGNRCFFGKAFTALAVYSNAWPCQCSCCMFRQELKPYHVVYIGNEIPKDLYPGIQDEETFQGGGPGLRIQSSIGEFLEGTLMEAYIGSNCVYMMRDKPGFALEVNFNARVRWEFKGMVLSTCPTGEVARADLPIDFAAKCRRMGEPAMPVATEIHPSGAR